MSRRMLPLLCCFLMLCGACAVDASPPEETAVDLTDAQTRHEMYAFQEEYRENRNGWADVRYTVEGECTNPGLRIATASGAAVDIGETAATGDLPLPYAKSYDVLPEDSDAFDWGYIIPASPGYVFTPRESDGCRVELSLVGYLGAEDAVSGPRDNNQYFHVDATGLREVEYGEADCVLSGTELEYTLNVVGGLQALWRAELTGAGETKLTVRRDGEDLLIYSESAPCEVRVRSGEGDATDLELGACPAGQWGRVTCKGADAALTLESGAVETGLDLLDRDAVDLLNHQFTVEHLDAESREVNLNGTARLEHTTDDGHPYPGFTVTAASGASLTVDGSRIQGELPLLSMRPSQGYGVNPETHAWNYTIPYSDQYVITLNPEQENITLYLDGYQGEEGAVLRYGDATQSLVLTATGAGEVAYSTRQCVLSGTDMAYELTPGGFLLEGDDGDALTVTLTGSGESRAVLKRDGDDVLVYSESAPCEVRASCREGGEVWTDLELGACPAGQWGRVTCKGADTALTLEPNARSPWLWAALPAALLLIAAVWLLMRRRKAR